MVWKNKCEQENPCFDLMVPYRWFIETVNKTQLYSNASFEKCLPFCLMEDFEAHT